MPNRDYFVSVNPSSFKGPIKDLARLLVPLVGQPSSALIKRLEKGEMRVDSDLSSSAAKMMVDRLRSMGIEARFSTKEISSSEIIDLDIDNLDINLDDIFLNTKISTLNTKIPQEAESAWGELFPDLDQPQNLKPKENSGTKSNPSPPSLLDLEQNPTSPSALGRPSSNKPNNRSSISRPRAVEQIMEDILPPKKRPPFEPQGFDNTYEHSPQLSLIFACLAPGAGHRYNGEDSKANTTLLSSFFVWPWIQSIKDSKTKAIRIQTYYAPRPKKGAMKRALVHGLAFWTALLFVIIVASTFYEQWSQPKPEGDEKSFVLNQVKEAITSAKINHQEARFSALESVRMALQIEPKVELSMSPNDHLRRLYAIGVMKCRKNQYIQCQAIMKRVSKIKPGYRDVLVLQTWASAQRSAKKKAKMPKIGEVESLEEIDHDSP